MTMIGTLLLCATLTAVDGDTFKCDGVNLRDMGDGAPFVSAYDAPEIWSRKCQAELELARKAKARMGELLRTPGLRIIDSGQRDDTRGHRPLVWAVLPDGRSIGSVLVDEGLAVEVFPPTYAGDWC